MIQTTTSPATIWDLFRRAIEIDARFPDAYNNLGTVLRRRGLVGESEGPLRRAVRLKPSYADAQVNLAATLVLLNRWREAKAELEKALTTAPKNVSALIASGRLTGEEGRFAEAEALYRRAALIDPGSSEVYAALIGMRRMTLEDVPWLKREEKIAGSGLAPHEEAEVRYAIGKFYDDVEDYSRAFSHYRLANGLQKLAAEPYDGPSHTHLVDDLMSVYTREKLAHSRAGASSSQRPVFVVGMPRSGTSLVEQIIASHPAAIGAGELSFWDDALRRRERAIRHQVADADLAKRLSGKYLSTLAQCSPDARRIVDKAPFNALYLGIIHSVFPRARLIYLLRDPRDTCLSCYFQPFSGQMNFALDLSDLAHYYRQQQRLLAHWRRVLPPGTLLEVPYAQLVFGQEKWTRRIVDFLGLPWDPRCLDFTSTKRVVLTASYWQVRQKMYQTSVGRWRHYEKCLGPLAELRDEVPCTDLKRQLS